MSYGILQRMDNAQIEDERRAEREKANANEHTLSRPVSRLADHCRKEWNRARQAKEPILERSLRNMRAREGVYEDNKLNAIREIGGSEIKMMLTDVKCRAAKAWIEDIILGSGERPFSCEPTPLPEIPKEIDGAIEAEALADLRAVLRMVPTQEQLRERIEEYRDQVLKEAKQMAEKQAERMEDKIDDEFIQGELYDALPDLIDDFVTHPAAILKGPVIHSKKSLAWAGSDDPVRPNAASATVTKKFQRMFYAVSPHDIYLTPEAKNSEQGSLIERHRISPADLYEFIGNPGFDDDQIRGALNDYADSGLRDWLWQDSERARLEHRPHETILANSNDIDALEVWTRVRGAWLAEWGMEGIDDLNRWYNSCCWIIGTHVIRATLNDDPLGKRPYHMASYVKVRNSPWGRSVPDLMVDLQNMCDAAARSISNNMGLSSGPMVEVEVDRLAEGERVTKNEPWRIVQTVSRRAGAAAPAVRYHQPQIVVDALMRVFEFFSDLADEYTGIPRYQYGDTSVGGAGKTAAGLSMLMNASSRTMKGVIRNIDRIIKRCTEATYRHIMLFDDDFEHKGDIEVKASATTALLHREAQQMRLKETLDATNNPIDFNLMGPKGRMQLLRAALRGLDSVDIDKVLPTSDQMLMQEFAARMQPPLGSGQDAETNPNGPQPQENVQGMAA